MLLVLLLVIIVLVFALAWAATREPQASFLPRLLQATQVAVLWLLIGYLVILLSEKV